MTTLTLKSEISRLINVARKSPDFDVKKIMELIDANDKDGLFKLVLNWIRYTFPSYFVVEPCYQDHIPVIQDYWLPIIMDEINKKPCGCHIDEPETLSPCKSKTCGCNCVTNCDKCLPVKTD
jgi:hypothetical protein